MAPDERLRPIVDVDTIKLYQVNTVDRMDRLTRTRITRQYMYVRYVYSENIRKFKSSHPVADVISFTASKLAEHFPAMRDHGSTIDKPTYVSVTHSTMFIQGYQ